MSSGCLVGAALERGHRGERHPQVDAVHHRSGESALVPAQHLRRAVAVRRARRGARARVGGHDELEARRVAHDAVLAGEPHLALLEWGAQAVEQVGPELVDLVEEEDPAVGHRHRAGPREPGAAPDECGRRHPVVRGDERRRDGQVLVRRQRPGQRAHGGHLHRLLDAEVGQQTGQPAGEHRLAGPGRADEQQVVPTRGRDLDGAAGDVLADDVGEVVHGGPWPQPGTGRRCGERGLPPQPREDLGEVGGPEQFDAVDEGGLVESPDRDDDARDPRPPRGHDARQYPADVAHPAVEGELAEQDDALEGTRAQPAVGGEDPAGQGDVVARALLGQRRRRERQGDLALRPVLPGVHHGGADPVAGLGEGGVGQPDQRQPRQPGPDVGLDLHQVAVHAVQTDRPRAGEPHQKAPS